eukprot:gb/GEZN01001262.1/.p2 GENE.gb/GEZN01001262.1/~~gb/GEZN01001262.1/.p2  ORF type:complete len:437 (+),score=82.43 gb/GEZN01001262.1/:1174-2484(+)
MSTSTTWSKPCARRLSSHSTSTCCSSLMIAIPSRKCWSDNPAFLMPKELSAEQKEARAGKEQGQNVEIALIEQQIAALFKFKILLLGAGESGKSTIVKQLKYIHKLGLDQKEKAQVAQGLHQNVVECMKALIVQAKEYKNPPLTEEDLATSAELDAWSDQEPISPELGEKITALFKGPAITATYERKNEYWLLDSFPYYMDNLKRFCEEDFAEQISEEDIVMARIRTTGIVQTSLKQKLVRESQHEPEFLDFEVVDVGGQRNERKKWLHCFDDVRAVLFIVNLAGWNQVLFEDNSKNRLEESLELFERVTSNKIFADTPIFLFLNKKDLFEKQIQATDMRSRFPEYDGGKDLHRAMQFISDKFNERLPPKKKVFIEFVSARLKADIRQAFNSVKKILYEDHREQLIKQAEELAHRQKQLEAERDGSMGMCSACTIL